MTRRVCTIDRLIAAHTGYRYCRSRIPPYWSSIAITPCHDGLLCFYRVVFLQASVALRIFHGRGVPPLLGRFANNPFFKRHRVDGFSVVLPHGLDTAYRSSGALFFALARKKVARSAFFGGVGLKKYDVREVRQGGSDTPCRCSRTCTSGVGNDLAIFVEFGVDGGGIIDDRFIIFLKLLARIGIDIGDPPSASIVGGDSLLLVVQGGEQ